MNPTQRLLGFGVFELNVETDELFKSGIPIKLPPQPLRILALLAGRPGQVVTRTEIQGQLWGEETHVDFDHGVNKCINQLRTALGDNSDNPIYIETLPRHGYRFVAPVVAKAVAAPQPKVIEYDSGQRSRPPVLITSRAKAAAAVTEQAAPNLAPLPDEKFGAEPAEVVPIQKPQSKFSRARLVWVGLAALLVALAGGGLYWRWRAHKAAALIGKGTLVLADFDNKTGDAIFDGTLRWGLSADLRQSPFLDILTDKRFAETTALMGQPKGSRLTPELARQVCIRTGSAATVEGSVGLIGNQYVIGLKVVNCQSGEEIAVQQLTVDSKQKVLPALGNAASQIRHDLGESLASVQRYNGPLQSVTTSSLEALQAYSKAARATDDGDYPAAIALFQRAIDLDPNFATAYMALGVSYGNLNLPDRGTQYLRKAYELRDRVGEREKLEIATFYADNVTGNAETARKAYKVWMQVYPNDLGPPTNLAFDDAILGDYDDALSAFQKVVKSHPESPLSYANLAAGYMYLDRLDEAKATALEASARHLDPPAMHIVLYGVDFLQHDEVGMRRDKAALVGQPGWEDQMLDFESDTAAYSGQFSRARGLTREAVDSAERVKEKEAAAAYKAEAAVREALVGNMAVAKQEARAALALSNSRDASAISAVALALAGDTVEATHLAEELAKGYPENTIVRYNYLPTIQAAIASRCGSPAKALEVLAPAAAYELGIVPGSANFTFYPVYLRGEAYLAGRQGSAAAAEFQKILDHPGVVLNEPISALAHLGQARAYALSGDTTKAKAAYQDFLALWKDADPEIPIYQQAKAEYAKLQ